jgi:translation elongation factor EF-G
MYYAGEIAAAVGLKDVRLLLTHSVNDESPIILDEIDFPEPVVSLQD